MSTTRTSRPTARPTARATTRWIDDFVIALRAREVPGPQIGDLVAEVESFVAESGETPDEAFGRPEDYATRRAAALAPVDPTGAAGWARLVAPSLLGVVGLLLVGPAVTGLRDGTPVPVRWGQLAMLALLVGIVAVLVRWIEPIARRAWLGIGVFAGLSAAMILVALVGRATVFSLPAGVALVAALALIAAATVGQLTWGRVEADPVVEPMTGRDRYADGSVGSRVVDLSVAVLPWLFVAAGLLSALLAWFVG